MRRITRYVLSEFLKVFVVMLIGMSSLMIIGVVLVEAVQQGLAPLSVLRLLPYAVPLALLFAIPVTTLFTVCSIYGRMSSANEITAVKATGVSPMTMVWPTLLLSIFLSLLVVWLNDVAVSWGRLGFKRVLLESVEQIAYSMLRTQRAYSSPRFSINVRGVDGKRLLNPTVTLRLEDGLPSTIVAEEAELRCDPVAETLTIVLRDSEANAGRFHVNHPGEFVQVIPLSQATRRGSESGRPADTELGRIPGEIRSQLARLEQLERDCAGEAAVQMLTGDLDGLMGAEWDSRYGEIQQGKSRLYRLKTEPWRRSANGFSCFFFALVGTPLAVRLRTADVWTSFGICFLPILVIYYPLMMYGVDLAKSGQLPPYCVWMGNGVMSIAGYVLIRKMLRY